MKRALWLVKFLAENLFFKDIVNFVQLIVFSVVEKILYLFDCLMPFGLNSQMRAGLQKRFDWPFHLTWQISGELKVSSN